MNIAHNFPFLSKKNTHAILLFH